MLDPPTRELQAKALSKKIGDTVLGIYEAMYFEDGMVLLRGRLVS